MKPLGTKRLALHFKLLLYINNFNISELKELEKFLSIDDDTLYKFYNNQIETIKNIDNNFIRLYKSYIYEKK